MEEKEVDMRDYLKVVGKRKWTIIITLLICLLVSFLFTFRSKPVYQVKSAFVIGSITTGPGMGHIMTPAATIDLCKSDYFLNKVREVLSPPKDEKTNIEVTATGSLIIISLDFSSLEKGKAVKIVSTAIDLIIKEHNRIYQQKIRELQEVAKGIQKQIELSRRSG